MKISPVQLVGKPAIRGKVVRSVTAWRTDQVGNRGTLEILSDFPKRAGRVRINAIVGAVHSLRKGGPAWHQPDLWHLPGVHRARAEAVTRQS
ncbi:hypothetical protein ACFPTO_10620 [Paraburkholderia denitrificans]|uniref:Uncharacterized protein n=1 Tax=Paraburkholderia denitrificans TaxID=694025 RepID=A0ABW0J858_9BURK